MSAVFLLLPLLIGLAACNARPAANGVAPYPARADSVTVLYLGDSITAGWGLTASQAYPALVQQRAADEGWRIRTVNAGVSGEVSAGGLRRIGPLLDRYDVDVFVLALGGNDGVRGLSPEALERNLDAIIEQVRAASPEVRIVLAGMQLPTEWGAGARAFNRVFEQVARRHRILLVPHLLADVAGVPGRTFPDLIHPNAEGQRVIAETVWGHLEPVLRETAGVP
jgi:acyl-CoA thioesterase I